MEVRSHVADEKPHDSGLFLLNMGNVINLFLMTFPASIFAACKRRIFLAKIVRIPRRVYSKQQIYLSFAIVIQSEL